MKSGEGAPTDPTTSDGLHTTPVDMLLWSAGTWTVTGPGNHLFRSYAYTGIPDGDDMQLVHLDPNCTYDLYMYSGFDDSTYTVAGEVKSVVPEDLASPYWFPGPPDEAWIEGRNYAVFRDLVPTLPTVRTDQRMSDAEKGYVIEVNYKSFTPAGNGSITGFTLVEIPEPATLVLLAIGSLGIIARRKRR